MIHEAGRPGFRGVSWVVQYGGYFPNWAGQTHNCIGSGRYVEEMEDMETLWPFYCESVYLFKNIKYVILLFKYI